MADEREQQISQAFEAGRRAGFGVAAVVMSCVAFLNLLSAEKAIVAIVFGVLALRGASQASRARQFGLAAVVIGTVFLISEVVLLIVFREELMQLIAALEKLG